MNSNPEVIAIRTARERILSATVYELAERGYPGCSLRSVARRAGVDSRLLAHYFGDKDALCAEALQQLCEPIPAPRRRNRPSSVGTPLAAALLREWGDEPPARRALFASALTEEKYGVTVRALLTGALNGITGGEPRTDSRTAQRRTALAISVVLGFGLLTQAGTAHNDTQAPPRAADLGAYLDLLLVETPL